MGEVKRHLTFQAERKNNALELKDIRDMVYLGKLDSTKLQRRVHIGFQIFFLVTFTAVL